MGRAVEQVEGVEHGTRGEGGDDDSIGVGLWTEDVDAELVEDFDDDVVVFAGFDEAGGAEGRGGEGGLKRVQAGGLAGEAIPECVGQRAA